MISSTCIQICSGVWRTSSRRMEKLIFITPSNNFINWLGQLSCSIPNQHDFWGWQQRKLTLTKGRWSSFWEVMFSCKNGFSAIRSKSHTSKVLHGLEILQCSFLGFVFFLLVHKTLMYRETHLGSFIKTNSGSTGQNRVFHWTVAPLFTEYHPWRQWNHERSSKTE